MNSVILERDIKIIDELVGLMNIQFSIKNEDRSKKTECIVFVEKAFGFWKWLEKDEIEKIKVFITSIIDWHKTYIENATETLFDSRYFILLCDNKENWVKTVKKYQLHTSSEECTKLPIKWLCFLPSEKIDISTLFLDKEDK